MIVVDLSSEIEVIAGLFLCLVDQGAGLALSLGPFLFPEALRLLAAGRLSVEGRRVRIAPGGTRSCASETVPPEVAS